jgi:hypothetical protein
MMDGKYKERPVWVMMVKPSRWLVVIVGNFK